MDNVGSAAMTFQSPAGASHDPDAIAGAGYVAYEWFFRGAGAMDSRALNGALDGLGCQHHEYVTSSHVVFGASQLGRNLAAVLKIYADILRRPRLEDANFGPCRELAVQDLRNLQDEPASRCNMLLREKFYPQPLGRCVYGSEQSLAAMTPERLREHIGGRFGPAGAVLAVAGNINWDSLAGLVGDLLGDWPAQKQTSPVKPVQAGGVLHVPKDSAQMHIGLAHKAVPFADKRSYAARLAQTVLSGGMSSRLFTEVREKRALVYQVGCSYNSLKNHAGMLTYAGTRPELAQQTLDVTVGELRRLADGIEPQEMDRAKVQLRSSLVMHGESTSARAGALASDWHHLGRLRGLDEILGEVRKVTIDDVISYLRQFPAEGLTMVVIGPRELDASILGGRR
ncbi:MAG: insulinase family protein [Planctomycetes bacterium]|nr:insulinase family protein [Planctomycetota bacterium]